MGAARLNPRSAAFVGLRQVPTDGPRVRNATSNQVRARFIPVTRQRHVALDKTGEMTMNKRSGAGDVFQFSDRAYKLQEDGSIRRLVNTEKR